MISQISVILQPTHFLLHLASLIYDISITGFFVFFDLFVLSSQQVDARQKENVGIVDTIEVIVNKKRGNANFEIKHNENGKETITITCKDEDGKEIKMEVPWEAIQRLRK